MKAALLYGPGKLVVSDVPLPSRPPGWVLVKSLIAGICGTDKAFYRGTYKLFKTPLIPGHEVVGVVVEGPRELAGKTVVPEINFPCWSCEYCRAGLYTHCPRKRTLGIDFDGGMAEYFVAPASALHVYRGPVENGVFVEPLAAVLRAISLYTPKPTDCVAVIGTGTVALLTVQVLHELLGFDVDVIARRGSRKASYFEKIARVVFVEEAPESGYDVVFEATGDPGALDIAVKIARPRGVIHLKSTPGLPACFNSTVAVVKELTIIGSRCGTHREFKRAIELLESGAIRPRLDKVYNLDSVVEAFEESVRGEYFKIAVKP